MSCGLENQTGHPLAGPSQVTKRPIGIACPRQPPRQRGQTRINLDRETNRHSFRLLVCFSDKREPHVSVSVRMGADKQKKRPSLLSPA